MSQRVGQAIRGPFPLGWAIVLGIGALLLGGCSRAFYRRQADREVYCLVDQAANDPRWQLEDFAIQPDPRSRLFDPFCPDRPPMPPDDPTSHRLMHCVDCKRGWPCWHRNGDASDVETCQWQSYLPVDDQGRVKLNRDGAVELARLHSREYQRAMESLYLSALDVTFERFRFDAQFFGTNATFYTADGRIRGPDTTQQTLNTDTKLRMERLFAPGGQLITELANSLVWQFAGPDGTNANTLFSYSLVQPLLRAGGRAVVMERLTDAERALVANVRQMEFFRRSFYTQVVVGRAAVAAPSRGGMGVSAVSSGGPVGGAGFFGLLEDQVRIRNERNNLDMLHETWVRLEAIYRAGRVNRYQVDLARQSLYTSQTRLLASLAGYQDRLDAYKVSVGLPPDVEMEISDPLLTQFDLIDPSLTATRKAINALLDKVRDPQLPLPSDYPTQIAAILQNVQAEWDKVGKDVQRLSDVLPKRQEDLKKLSGRPELQRGEVDPGAYSVDDLNSRAQSVSEDFAQRSRDLSELRAPLEDWLKTTAGKEAEAVAGENRERLVALLTSLGTRVLQVSLVQAGARLDSIRLVPADVDPKEAIQVARENRLDWMNARAALVDVWRQIEIRANALRAGLNFTFSGNLNNTDNNPINFHSTTGQLRVGVQFDAPLTRLAERNAYRESLISYQQARRDYLLATDRVYQGLRSTIRTMEVNQLDFEIRRAAVVLAISQVDLAQRKLEEPPRPGQKAEQLGDTTARDLLDALSRLLESQNSLLNAWVDYEAERLSLDLDLGTMQLDERGLWIDPGPLHLTKGSRNQQCPPADPNVVYPEPAEAVPPSVEP